MSSSGAQSNHINHVQTQMQYAMVVVAACVPGYLIAGFTENWLITLVSSLAILTAALLYLRRRSLGRGRQGIKKKQCFQSGRHCPFFVGATIGRPSTYRSNAFSGKVSSKANRHGRAMLAPISAASGYASKTCTLLSPL